MKNKKKNIKINFSCHTLLSCHKDSITNGIWELILFHCFRIRSFKSSTHCFIRPNAHLSTWFSLYCFNWIVSSISTSLTMFSFLKQPVPKVWLKKEKKNKSQRSVPSPLTSPHATYAWCKAEDLQEKPLLRGNIFVMQDSTFLWSRSRP